jgi:hypothetical protein
MERTQYEFSWTNRTGSNNSGAQSNSMEQEQKRKKEEGDFSANPLDHPCVLVGTGGSSYKELWTELDATTTPLVLGLNPKSSHRVKKFKAQYDTLAEQGEGPPLYLDHLLLNNGLRKIRIRKVAVGSIHSLLLTDDGYVYAMGHNADGQLLTYNERNQLNRDGLLLPMLIRWFVDRNIRIRDIVCGGWFSAFITTTGRLFTVGRLTSFYSSTVEPMEIAIEAHDEVNVFGAGNIHLLYQTKNYNDVWGLGLNSEFELALKHNKHVDTPEKAKYKNTERQEVEIDFRVSKIDGGEKFSIIQNAVTKEVYIAGTDRTFKYDVFTKFNPFTCQIHQAIIDFTCSWGDALFLNNRNQIAIQTIPGRSIALDGKISNGSALLFAGAHVLYVADRHRGLQYKVGRQECELIPLNLTNCPELIDNDYEITSAGGGYFISICLYRSKLKHKSIHLFLQNMLKQSISSPFFDLDINCTS